MKNSNKTITLYLDTLSSIEDLIDKKLKTYRTFFFLVGNMNSVNESYICQKDLMKYLDCSRQTLYRSIKTLEKKGLICICKKGTFNYYIINPDVVWNNSESKKFECKFKSEYSLKSINFTRLEDKKELY